MTSERPAPATDRARIEPHTTMAEVLQRSPGAPAVLMRFHIGGCSLCGFDPADPVEKVAADNGVPVDVLLAALNG